MYEKIEVYNAWTIYRKGETYYARGAFMASKSPEIKDVREWIDAYRETHPQTQGFEPFAV